MEDSMVSISVSIAAVIAASIAAIYAGKQVSEAKKVTKLQIMSHVYQSLTELYNEPGLTKGNLKDIMEKILKDKETATISDLPDEPVNYRIAVAKVRAFYEEIGHYINEHEEYEKLLLDIVGRSPVEVWKLLEPIVRNEREEHGESESHFFEELVKKIETKQPKLTHRKMPN